MGSVQLSARSRIGSTTHENMASRNKNKPRLSQRAKQERRKDMSEIQEKMFSVVVPVIATFAMLVVLIIYIKTRPRTTDF